MRRGLFQWNYFLIVLPIHLIAVFITIAPLPIPIDQLWRWIVMSLLSYGITAIAFAVAKYFENSMNSAWQEIGAAVLIGLARGFAILDISLLMGLPTVKPYILRPLNSAISFPLWLLVIHLLLGTRREFINEFHKMYVRAITSQISATKSTNRATAEELSFRIESSLKPLRQQFERVLGAKISTQQLADEALIIRSFVDAEIRPLSHELWRSRKFQPPRLSFVRILQLTMLRTQLPLHIVIALSSAFSLVGLTVYYDFQIAYSISGLSLLLMGLWNGIYLLLFNKTNLPKPLLNSLSLLLGTFMPMIVIELLIKVINFGTYKVLAEIIGGVWFLVMITAFTIYRGINQYYDSVRAIMQNQIDSMKILDSTSEGAQLRREFASYLHGDIQSELLSASMQMSQAAESGNINLGKKALKRADELLKRDHQTYVVGSAIASNKKLERLANAWQGIADIQFSIDKDSQFSESSLDLINDVVEELVTNSVRHGGASKIRIEIAQTDGDISVVYQDNGSEIKGRKKGLGTELLTKRTLSYSYQRTEDGNRIEIELPN